MALGSWLYDETCMQHMPIPSKYHVVSMNRTLQHACCTNSTFGASSPPASLLFKDLQVHAQLVGLGREEGNAFMHLSTIDTAAGLQET